MVFSMLLLGVFSAVLVVMFDFWFGNEKSLSTIVAKRLIEANLPYIWIISVSGLSLLASGFFFHLSSFFIIAFPSIVLRDCILPSLYSSSALFAYVADHAFTLASADGLSSKASRGSKNAFLFMLLTSVSSENSANVRFVFTQLMYARSLGAIFVIFTAYACWVSSVALSIGVAIFLCMLLLCSIGYLIGLRFFEDVMACGYLVEQVCKQLLVSSSSNKKLASSKADEIGEESTPTVKRDTAKARRPLPPR
jgi:hypothetical protein